MFADVADLVTANAATRLRAVEIAQLTAERHVRGFRSWYDHGAIAKLAADITVAVEASQRQVTALTNAYLMRAVQSMTGRRVGPVATIDVSTLRAGTSHVGVYGRLADQHRFLVASGLDEVTATDRGVQRVKAMIATDVALAFRSQAQAFMLERGIERWRRVIRPELTAGECGLCPGNIDVHDAATLMPIHHGCVCDLAPVIDDLDPAAAMNEEDRLHVQALPAGDVIVHQHGELGPILADRYQQWRGPADVAAA